MSKCPSCGAGIEYGVTKRCRACGRTIPSRGPVFDRIMAARARVRIGREGRGGTTALRLFAILGWLSLAILCAVTWFFEIGDRRSAAIFFVLSTGVLGGALSLSIQVDRMRAARRMAATPLVPAENAESGIRVPPYPRLGTIWEVTRLLALFVLAGFATVFGATLVKLAVTFLESRFR